MKPGYLYVLIHPSDPELFKIGQTTRTPEERLNEHNCNFSKIAGKIVRETGQKWILKTYIEVPDPYWAEAIFWNASPYAALPYRYGIEMQKMSWDKVEAALKAASKAGIRPAASPLADYVYAYRAWMNKSLQGRGIKLLGEVKSKTGKSDFICSNGHKWRTTPILVAEGEGCPICSIGQRTMQEIKQLTKTGTIYLLINPNQPELIKISNSYDEENNKIDFGEWRVHRYRKVEEPFLAISLICELLNISESDLSFGTKYDLKIAEKAFRELHYLIVAEIALSEIAKDMI